MTQDYDSFNDFPDEPEDEGIAPEVGIKKLKQDLERKNKQISEVERMAQDNAREAQEAKAALSAQQKERIEDERARAENNMAYFQTALETAMESGDNKLATKIQADMMAETVRLDRLRNAIVPQPTVQYQAPPIESYDDLVNSKGLNTTQREFLTDRPELKDPENFRIFMGVIKKLNQSQTLEPGSKGWLKEVDKRLALNEVYEKRDARDQEEDEPMTRDKDEYRDRSGSPRERDRDNAPPSMPKGRDASAPNFRTGKGVARLTPEQREFARTMNLSEESYIRGLSFAEYAKAQPANPVNGAMEYEVGDNGKLTVSLGSYADFNNMYNRNRR